MSRRPEGFSQKCFFALFALKHEKLRKNDQQLMYGIMPWFFSRNLILSIKNENIVQTIYDHTYA